MTMKIITAIAVATSVLAMSSAAEAGNKRNGFYAGDHVVKVSGKRHRKHRRHVRHGFHFGHDYYGHNPYRSCRRLKRKAYYTGSRYWWKRYQRCMDRHYY